MHGYVCMQIGWRYQDHWFFFWWWLQTFSHKHWEKAGLVYWSACSLGVTCFKSTSGHLVDSGIPSHKAMAYQTPSALSFSLFPLFGLWFSILCRTFFFWVIFYASWYVRNFYNYPHQLRPSISVFWRLSSPNFFRFAPSSEPFSMLLTFVPHYWCVFSEYDKRGLNQGFACRPFISILYLKLTFWSWLYNSSYCKFSWMMLAHIIFMSLFNAKLQTKTIWSKLRGPTTNTVAALSGETFFLFF